VFEPIVLLKHASPTTNEQDHIFDHKPGGQDHMGGRVDSVQGQVTNGIGHMTGMEDSGHHTSRRLLQTVERIRVTQAQPGKKRDMNKNENFVILLSMSYSRDSNSSSPPPLW